MKVNLGGLVHLSTVDWPGLSVSVVFLRGCPLRCPHCINPKLQEGESWEEVAGVIREIWRSSPFISAVVFSGGEPTEQLKALRVMAGRAKELGLMVGLETCGYYPDRLASLLEDGVVDKVFLDVKAALRDPEYFRATGVRGAASRVLESLRSCLGLGVPLEVRTTVFPGMPSSGELKEIAETLGALTFKHPGNGLEIMVLQQGWPVRGDPVSPEYLREVAGILEGVKVEVMEKWRSRTES